MLATTFLVFALAATGLAQAPAGYRKVYMTSMVDSKFVIVPKSATNGSTIVVLVLPSLETAMQNANLDHFYIARQSPTSQSSSGMSKMATAQFSMQVVRSAWMQAPRVSMAQFRYKTTEFDSDLNHRQLEGYG
jgi:hypothetical protein